MQRIRGAHPDARLDLLTTPPYVGLGAAIGLFDRIDADGRPSGLLAHLRLARRLRAQAYDRVYDLQTSDRSTAYRLMFWPHTPQWSGLGRGASHRHDDPGRTCMHTLERQAQQLERAGIWPDAPTAPGSAPPPDLSFLPVRAGPESFGLRAPYALLVPGASVLRPGKRWPADCYASLARHLAACGLRVGIVGGTGEAELAARLARDAGAIDLAGRTDFGELAVLGRHAALSVGNDTGPMHLLAATGVPSLVLFSQESDPTLCAPRGRRVQVLRRPRLADLPLEAVQTAADALMR